MSGCRDYSFGLTERDIQVTNAKVNQILSACKCQCQFASSTIFSTAYLTSDTEIHNPVPPNLVPLSFERSAVSNPTTFVSDANGFFTIPEDGLWRIASTVAVTEYAGMPTGILLFLSVNGEGYAPESVFDVMGYASIDANQSDFITGEVCKYLNQGDTVRVMSTEYFGSSTNVVARSGISNTTGTYNLSRICLQKIS